MLRLLESKEQIKIAICNVIKIDGKEEVDLDFLYDEVEKYLSHADVKLKSKKTFLRYMQELDRDIKENHLQEDIPIQLFGKYFIVDTLKPMITTHLIVYYLQNSIKYLLLFHSLYSSARTYLEMLSHIETDEFAHLFHDKEKTIETTEVTLRKKRKELNEYLQLHLFHVTNDFMLAGKEINTRIFFYELFLYFMNGAIQSKKYIDHEFGILVAKLLATAEDVLDELTNGRVPLTKNEETGFGIFYGLSSLRASYERSLDLDVLENTFLTSFEQDEKTEEIFQTIKNSYLLQGFSEERSFQESQMLLGYLYTELPSFQISRHSIFQKEFLQKVDEIWQLFLDTFKEYYTIPLKAEHIEKMEDEFKRVIVRSLLFKNLGVQNLILRGEVHTNYSYTLHVLREFVSRMAANIHEKQKESTQKAASWIYFNYLQYPYLTSLFASQDDFKRVFEYLPAINIVIDFVGMEVKKDYVLSILEKRYGFHFNVQSKVDEMTDVLISNIWTEEFNKKDEKVCVLWNSFLTRPLIEELANKLKAIQKEKLCKLREQ